MNINLEGKVALVCGASQGMGRETALRFAECGADVIAVSRNIDLLNSLLLEFSNNGNQRHTYVAADFKNYMDSFDSISEHVRNHYAGVDIIINNSGGPKSGKLVDAEIEDFINAFNSHLFISQLLVKHFSKGMAAKKDGRIINIVSVSARQPIDNLGVSNTLRGAMLSWAKTLSKELGGFGITVNNILPGYTATDRLNSLFERESDRLNINIEDVKQNILSKIPARRLGMPDELSYLAVFLASDYAKYINGVSIPIDGGFISCV